METHHLYDENRKTCDFSCTHLYGICYGNRTCDALFCGGCCARISCPPNHDAHGACCHGDARPRGDPRISRRGPHGNLCGG